MTITENQHRIWALCRACGHEWIFAWTPIEAGKFCKLLKRATCPKCAEDRDIAIPGTNERIKS